MHVNDNVLKLCSFMCPFETIKTYLVTDFRVFLCFRWLMHINGRMFPVTYTFLSKFIDREKLEKARESYLSMAKFSMRIRHHHFRIRGKSDLHKGRKC